MPTRRENLAMHLMDGEMTARELAELTGAQLRLVLDDLEHVRRSYRRAFVIRPARCQSCDFELRSRQRVSTPSRCPRCRSEHVAGPWLRIESSKVTK